MPRSSDERCRRLLPLFAPVTLALALSCRTTDASRTKDLTPYGGVEFSGALGLPLIPDGLNNNPAEVSSFALEQAYLVKSSPAPETTPDDFFALFTALQKAPAEGLQPGWPTMGAFDDGDQVRFQFPGKAPLTLTKKDLGSPPSVRYAKIQTGLRDSGCPLSDIPFTTPSLTAFQQIYPKDKLTIAADSKETRVNLFATSFSAKTVHVKFRCSVHALLAPANFPVNVIVTGSYLLSYDRPVFDVAPTDASFPVMRQGAPPTEQDGRGTRYTPDYYDLTAMSQASASPGPQKGVASTPKILRWNLAKNRIVIEDQIDADGQPLRADIQQSIHLAVSSLRAAYPPLGQRVVTRTEINGRTADANFLFLGRSSLGLNVAGEASMIYDDANGEIRFAGISYLEDEAKSSRRSTLESLGLIADPDLDARLGVQATVLHEIGHALGLRHNFSGYGVASGGKGWMNSIMSYGHVVPFEYTVSDQMGYLEHDVLSLRYLYADLSPNPEATRSDALQRLMQLPLSREELGGDQEGWEASEHYCQGAKFLESANSPKLAAFRAAHPDFKDIFERQVYGQSNCGNYVFPTIAP